MALQKREKILAAVTGVLLLVFLATMLFSGGGNSLGQLRLQRDKLAEDVSAKKEKIQFAQKAVTRLAAWQQRSLPSNRDHARSLYQNWLREVVTRVGLDDVTVDSSEGQTRRDIYTALTFSIHGRGTIEQLTRLLFEFYSADHLQKIRHLSIKPAEGSNQLTLVLSIEALSLPGATRTDELCSEKAKRLDLAKLSEYADVIVKRKLDDQRPAVPGGLFLAYSPPPPEHAPEPVVVREPEPEPDPTLQIYVNTIVSENGRPQVWLFDRAHEKTLRYHEGDTFEFGSVRGTIVRIDARKIEIEVNGRHCQAALRDSLHDSLPDEPPAEPSEQASDTLLDMLLDGGDEETPDEMTEETSGQESLETPASSPSEPSREVSSSEAVSGESELGESGGE